MYAFVVEKAGGKLHVTRPSAVEHTLVLGKERVYFSLEEMLNLPEFKKAAAKKKLEALGEGKTVKLGSWPILVYRLTAQNEALLEEVVKTGNELDVVNTKISNSIPTELLESKEVLTAELKKLKKMVKSLDPNVILKV